uniref:PID domain-containing protein n=1 Tax=Steinernema glaseri TaxID=37863 RepID=A0A1I8AEG1_9BILA
MPSLAASQSAAAQFFSLPFRRKRQSYTLNPPDDVHQVVYLGNVVTIYAKGQQSVEKPLGLIWKTYVGRQQKNDMQMKLMVTRSGLKAETKQQ